MNMSDQCLLFFQNDPRRTVLGFFFFFVTLKNIKMLQRTSPHCWRKEGVPSSGHNEGSTSFDSVHLHHSAGHPSC